MILAGMTETYGERLRRLRRERGWSQEDLAQEAGVDRQTIGRHENDNVKPKGETLIAIAEALQVAIDTLVSSPQDDLTPSGAPATQVREETVSMPIYDHVGPAGFVSERPIRRYDLARSAAVPNGVFWRVGDDSFGTINDGDLLQVDPDARPRVGDLVLASISDGPGELWRYTRRGGEIVLVTDNPRVTPYCGPFQIIGVVVTLTRIYRRRVSP